jgi:EmrB/QacA subfamily drug resistance transporter
MTTSPSTSSTIDPSLTQADERWVLISTILASSMAFIDGTALNVALPSLQAGLNASGEQLLWVLNAYLLMLAAFILVGGSLGDRLGRKKVYMLGITLFSLASLGCGLSPTIQWLIATRVLQGIGGALMIPGSLAIISALVAPERRGKAIGTWSAATTLVTVAGPILGGVLADRGLWRAVFLINPPIGIFTLLVLYLKVPESRDASVSGPIDSLGAVLVTLGLAGLTYGFISAPDFGFKDPRIFGTLVIGALALIAFIWVEIRQSQPMMPLHLFRSSTFSGTNLLTLFLYGALNVAIFFLALNLVQVQGYSKTQAGFAFLPFAGSLILMSRWSGGLADRRGPRLLLIAGPALAGFGFLWMAFSGLTRGPGDFWTTFFPGILLFGIGMGFTVAPLSSTVMGSVPTHAAGVASGVNNAVSRIAGVLAIAIVGSIALFVFAGSLRSKTQPMKLSPAERASVQAEAQKLAGASVPADISPADVPAVDTAIKLAFVDTYRLVMLVCAGLAWLSAGASASLVEARLAPGGEAVAVPGDK